MFKVRITAINPSTPPRPYGGTSSLIPKEIAVGGDRSIDITITIDSNNPDTAAVLKFEGDDPATVETITKQVGRMYGMYGHQISDATTPLDLDAALSEATWIVWEILEGADILKMPRQKLPPGAVW